MIISPWYNLLSAAVRFDETGSCADRMELREAIKKVAAVPPPPKAHTLTQQQCDRCAHYEMSVETHGRCYWLHNTTEDRCPSWVDSIPASQAAPEVFATEGADCAGFEEVEGDCYE